MPKKLCKSEARSKCGSIKQNLLLDWNLRGLCNSPVSWMIRFPSLHKQGHLWKREKKYKTKQMGASLFIMAKELQIILKKIAGILHFTELCSEERRWTQKTRHINPW